MSTLQSYLAKQRTTHLDQLKELLAIPSVSSDSRRTKDTLRAAKWVRSRLKAVGCTTTELHQTEGHPIVYGEWLGAGDAPTILVYGHYDVQPEDPLELWTTPPFEPTVKDGKLFARGAADDKGQFIIHLNALEAHLKVNGTCPINVKFLIEGEEEIGSSNLEPFLRANKAKLACDAVVVSDTAMFAKGIPSICYGLRGLAYLEISVRGTDRDLHSGSYGGAVVNPANALVTMLASLKDAKGRVTVPRFYNAVRRLTVAERRAFGKLPHSDRAYRQAINAPELWGEDGYSTLERVWVRPSLDINGIWSGFTGEGAKTVIPAEAHAKISMRLVPDQNPKQIARDVMRHLKQIAPKSVKISVTELHGGEAWIASPDHPAIQAASRALERAFGAVPVMVREGGSIPIVASFQKRLDVPTVLMGIGLNDDNLHAPNEKIDLDQFYGGMEAAAYLMEELAATTTEKPRRTAGRRR